MLFDLPYRQAWFAALCLVPAVVRWWAGRSLKAHLDDPLLPERLLAQRRRNHIVLGFLFAGSVIVGTFQDLVWAIPLFVVSCAAAGYPLRRALYDERWSLAGYLAGMGRLLLAVAGFRLVLAFVPVIAASAGSFDWLASIALGVMLLFWLNRSAEWFRFILRAKPLDKGPLLTRFEALAAASTAPAPRFDLVDFRGGAIANAVALASRRGSSVVYTDTLLRLLGDDEAAAVTAHELAHLEYYDDARLRTLNRITAGLVVVAAGAPLLARLIPGMSLLTLEVAWLAMYAGVMAWTVRDFQRNETASDLRAVHLCGDAEALVRGLTTIYTFSRVPRRWDTQMEHAASHPSLARRIRAIRAAAGAVPTAAASSSAPAAAVASETLRGADGRAIVTFADALHWQESEGALHVLPYGQLTELRLDVRAGPRTRLVALERGGRRWEAPLDAAEAARAQAILDRVDGRLAEPPPRTLAIPWLQAAGAIVAVSAMWAGQFAVAIIAIGAALRSATAFFAAAGAAAIGAAALAGRQMIESGDLGAAWPALGLIVFGAALLHGAWRNRTDEGGRLANAGTAGLAALALLSVAAIALRGGDVVRLYQASAALPSGAVLPLALAAALATRPRRAWRIAAVPICLVGVMIGVAGSGTFLHAFGRDPFLVAAEPMPIQTLTGPPIADVTLPGMLSDLRLSPQGKRIAMMNYSVGSIANVGPRHVRRFSVGAPGSGFTTVAASDLLFIDDDRVLTMTVDGTRSRLQELRPGSDAVAWEQSIEDLSGPRLAYRRGSNRWVVTGMNDEGRIVSAEGAVGGRDLTRREWQLMDRGQMSEAWAVEGDTALRAHRAFDFDPRDAGATILTMAALLGQMETRLTRVTPAGQTPVAVSQLETICTDHAFDGQRLVCMAYDGARTHVLAFTPTGDAPQPLGSLGGRFLTSRPTREGWVSGWAMTGAGAVNMTGQVAMDLVSRRLLTVPAELRANEITAAGRVAAILTHDASSTRVRLYSLDR